MNPGVGSEMYRTPPGEVKHDVRDDEAVTDADLAHCRAVESLTVEAGGFDHAAHIRLAWTYLETRSLERALEDCAATIRRYAEHHGAYDKFHATITAALVRIIATRIEAGPRAERFDAFAARNRDLFVDAPVVLARFFSAERLADPRARGEELEPDLAPIS